MGGPRDFRNGTLLGLPSPLLLTCNDRLSGTHWARLFTSFGAGHRVLYQRPNFVFLKLVQGTAACTAFRRDHQYGNGTVNPFELQKKETEAVSTAHRYKQ